MNFILRTIYIITTIKISITNFNLKFKIIFDITNFENKIEIILIIKIFIELYKIFNFKFILSFNFTYIIINIKKSQIAELKTAPFSSNSGIGIKTKFKISFKIIPIHIAVK